MILARLLKVFYSGSYEELDMFVPSTALKKTILLDLTLTLYIIHVSKSTTEENGRVLLTSFIAMNLRESR